MGETDSRFKQKTRYPRRLSFTISDELRDELYAILPWGMRRMFWDAVLNAVIEALRSNLKEILRAAATNKLQLQAKKES